MTWPTLTLRELAISDGQYGLGSPSKEFRDGDPRYVRITDIRDNGQLSADAVAPDCGASDWRQALLKEGDLLFARSGATVGKTYLHPPGEAPAVYAGYLIRFQLNPDRVLPKFVFHYTKSRAYSTWVASTQRAVAQPNINAKQYAELPVPVPPLDEQRRIVAILDHADDLRTKQRCVVVALDRLIRAIFAATFDACPSGPRWPIARLGDVVPSIDSGTSPVCENRTASDGEWGVLKLGAISYGVFNPEENKAFLGDPASIRKVEVEPGDLLFSRKNTKELVGATAIAYRTLPRLLLPDLIFRLNLDRDRVDAEYLHALLRSTRTRPAVVALASGSASSMSNISKGRLAELLIELPPIELQHAYSDRVRAVNALRDQSSRVLVELDDLLSTLQSRAFSGQL